MPRRPGQSPGESHKYVPSTGAYARIVPAHAFSPSEGYWGTWELGARVSYVDLDSDFNSSKAISGQPAAIDGGRQTSYTAGISWFPNSYMVFKVNYIHTDYDRANPTATTVAGFGTAKVGAPVGASIDAVALRTQVNW